MNRILLPIAWLYQGILAFRHKLYDWHVLPSKSFDLPVICIGNLSFGGTGKTPHTEHLVRLLQNDYRVATLSRGYGRKTKGFVIADAHSTAFDIGDEPKQYHDKFPKLQVAVDENRVEGVERLLQIATPPQVILLDDALQHRRINPGLTLLLTEYGRLYTDDCLVPVGMLRDVRASARRADIIVVSKTPKNIDATEQASIVKRLKPRLHQKVFFSYLDYDPLRPTNAIAKQFDLNQTESALLFCGIAHPESLIEVLKKQFKTIDTLSFNDHHPYQEKDIKAILKRHEQLPGKKKIIITTEKDYARFKDSPYLCQFESAPLFIAPIQIGFFEEQTVNKEILSYVRKNSQDG